MKDAITTEELERECLERELTEARQAYDRAVLVPMPKPGALDEMEILRDRVRRVDFLYMRWDRLYLKFHKDYPSPKKNTPQVKSWEKYSISDIEGLNGFVASRLLRSMHHEQESDFKAALRTRVEKFQKDYQEDMRNNQKEGEATHALWSTLDNSPPRP